jgi:hypothetical protein
MRSKNMENIKHSYP